MSNDTVILNSYILINNEKDQNPKDGDDKERNQKVRNVIINQIKKEVEVSRVSKNHLINNILGDISKGVYTRSKVCNLCQ